MRSSSGRPRPGNLRARAAAGGDNAAVAAEDGTLAFVSLDDATAKPPLTVDVHDEINDVTYTPDGGRVAAVGQAGTLSVWNVATGEEVHRSSWGRPLFGVAASPNGQWLALGGEDCMLRIVRTEEPDITVHAIDLASVRTGRKTDSEIESIAFIDDAQVAVAFGHQLVFVDRDRGDVLQSIDAAKNPSVIDRLRVSPDRTMIFTAGGSERVPRLWNSHTRELIARFLGNPPDPRRSVLSRQHPARHRWPRRGCPRIRHGDAAGSPTPRRPCGGCVAGGV